MSEKENVEIIMKRIRAIEEYRRSKGDTYLIEKYYQEHGSYNGIVEYLESLTSLEKGKKPIK